MDYEYINKEYIEDQIKRTAEIEYDTALVKMFKVLGGDCLRDGNMYGAVIGDLPSGCSGFKKTRLAAIVECMHNFYNEEVIVPKN